MAGQQIHTTRFGAVAVEPGDALTFPAGILGLDDSTSWVLLAEANNDALGWLQSTERGELALAVVNPRRFVTDYQIRVTRGELGLLALNDVKDAHVLVIVSRHEGAITLNLKAPLLVNMPRRLGAQVINNVDVPLQYRLGESPAALKKSA